MKAFEFQQKKQQVDAYNNAPDLTGNNLIFGVRQQCLNPTLLNQQRERLGYRPELQSPFNQCQVKRPRN